MNVDNPFPSAVVALTMGSVAVGVSTTGIAAVSAVASSVVAAEMLDVDTAVSVAFPGAPSPNRRCRSQRGQT